ncbi:MAG TPA: hypothetical protein VKU90_06570 [Caulobacteraceae bacterium]|nr:hypothetical protein [Caulobacteraceae bacterium]
MKRLLALAALAVMLMAGGQVAAQGAPHIVRGVVAAMTGNSLTITTKDGKTVAVTLAPTWMVAVLKPIPVSAIQPGSFIGTTEMPQADGTGVSVEVHVFPPGVKMGEGHYPWDLQPGAMMTNGTVGTVTAVSNGQALDVSYPGGTRHVVVPANVPIVLITPGGDHALVHTGVAVFLVAQAAADGSLTAGAVSVGADGAPPPM